MERNTALICAAVALFVLSFTAIVSYTTVSVQYQDRSAELACIQMGRVPLECRELTK